MSTIKVKWYGPTLTRNVRRHMNNNLKEAAKWYRDSVRTLISIQGPPRSDPKDPPHREFGNLIDSYLWELDRAIMTARIGSGMIPTRNRMAPYARYLEYGTASGLYGPIEARPHLRPALINGLGTLGTMMTKPMS